MMKFRNNKYVRWGITIFLVIAASISFYYLLFHGTKIKAGISSVVDTLMPIVSGFVMAYLMTPILNYLENHVFIPLCKKCKIKKSPRRTKLIRAVGIVLTLLLFFSIIYGIFAMLISQIVPSITNIILNFNGYINNFIAWLNKFLSDYPDIGKTVVDMIDKYSIELEKWLNETLIPQTSELIKTVSLSVINVLKLLWNFLIGLMISVYILASKEKFAGQAKKIAYAFFNNETANIVINNFRFTHRTFIGFLSGKILDSIIIGILCFIGTSILNTPYAVLVSVVIGITNVIPVFGPYLGAIPSIILIFVVDPLHPLNCVYFAIFILILQQFDGNVLGPKILGNSTGLAGFWVIFSITLFGGFFGVFGMLIGVPVFAVLYAAIKSIVIALLKKKNMPLDTDAYINLAAIKENTLYEYVPDYKLKKREKDQNVFGKEFICNIDSSKMDSYYNLNVADIVEENVDADARVSTEDDQSGQEQKE